MSLHLESGGSSSSNSKQLYKAGHDKTTAYVVLVCLTAASGGLLFGYDLGISGGVSTMDDFLLKFFPKVYRKKNDAKTDNYCKFDSQLLTLFTSSLYFAGLIASFVASRVTRDYGRRVSILTGGICFLLGSILDGVAQNLWMLLLGRIILGVGLGFTNQAVPLYLSEMAPSRLRGRLTTMFQVAIGLGGTSAFLVNYGTVNIIPWGWRLSLSLAFVPALIITIAFAFLPDLPSSLIQRGHLDDGLMVLKRLRGTPDVQEEFNYLLQATELSKSIQSPWKSILQRQYRPQLIMAFAIPFFQQVTGINIITFYMPILFQTLGFGTNASLYSTIILGVISIGVTAIGALCIDKFGRRKVFFWGGSTMLLFLVLTGALLQWKLKSHNELSTSFGIVGILLILGFVVAFAWSWGPLAWLIPSEIFPLEIRCRSTPVIPVSSAWLFLFTWRSPPSS
ncbi:hypothetical protein GOP47_0020809 [Adiantum capillus-veneris]|uniref:Major facilitator superfamily (MFS) profile domain-containing protein n=1 Tax=Adiantum capillus-veneris TaxID=13818 RepID=A0A9D4UBG4_ADICA|nr:hypothetical protein GOP47_0020809 [Adiantum capillus-veneris]